MIWGLTTHAFTLVHVALSLIGIFTGLVVVFGLLTARPLDGWSAIFLATTIATSVTGFGFPFDHFEPPHVVGVISLAVLAMAVVARYGFHIRGSWRWIYVISAIMALYLNVFVGVVQAFQKIPALHALAPKQSEPPFVIAQLVVLAIFVIVGIFSTIRFTPASLRTA
ncbi:MAG TPA: hypothetical protein VER58_11555 [Thermoanaerobaculia bacterium]|nr:hypothetical protein [Thermoanaerobaculia bacterium]